MSEGPPKKPENHAEHASTLDTQQVFDDIGSAVSQLRSFRLPGEGKRKLQALDAARQNIEYLIERGQDPGPAYLTYVRDLSAVVTDEELWASLERQVQEKAATLSTFRLALRRYHALLEGALIEQFPFTGRIQ